MSKVNCLCGNQLSDACYPCKHKGTVLSETQIDSLEYADIITKKPKMVDNAINIILDAKEIWECPKCGRIAVIMDDNIIQWYNLEFNKIQKRLFV